MKQQFQDVITEQVSACYPDFKGGDLLGGFIKPILINSALLSAQNRQRLYWTNIPNIEQPEDKGIVLKDILQDEIDSEYYYGEKSISYMETGNDKWQQAGKRRADRYEQNANKQKSFTITENWHKGVPYNYFKETKPKQADNREPKYVSGAWRGRYKEDGATEQKLELNQSGKSNSLTTAQKDSVVVSTKPNQINSSKKAGGKQPYMQDRVFHKEGKSHALTRSFANTTNVGEENKLSWRKLTPLECMRLQTVPDDYLMPVSNTQKYKMLGNGMTVDVIAHILSHADWSENGL